MSAYGVGTAAFLDSKMGLIPCEVKAIDGREVTVFFTDEDHAHWSGVTRNVWKGRTETFRATRVVPRAVVVDDRIGQYRWDGDVKPPQPAA